MPGKPSHEDEISPGRTWRAEALGIAGLLAVAAYFLWVSWRKWPDPLIDFGRELYIPWRLAGGAVMYRDVDDFYGPLSQYINAGLFRAFGPGMMVLVAANLAVFAAICAFLYALVRRAWGAPAALLSTAVFITVFGFSQLSGVSNFNYATPYAHEATHGMLACAALLLVLYSWLERPARWHAPAAGLLFGVTAVLKPEIMLAAGVVTAAALGAALLAGARPGWRQAALWAAGAAAPTALFAAYFSLHVASGEAVAYSCRAWLNVVASTRYVSDPIQRRALGFDAPWAHLRVDALRTAGALALFGGAAGLAWLSARTRRAWAKFAALAAGIVVCGGCAWRLVDWMEVGRCLVGLVLAYVAHSALLIWRRRRAGASAAAQTRRLLFALLAATLMARMLLHGRVYQFGFYQAALAAVLVVAVLIGEVPWRLPLDRGARFVLVGIYLAVLWVGLWRLVWISRVGFDLKTVPVGEGRDLFYAYSARINPTGELVAETAAKLSQVPPGTLLVLPEGEMINYLARLPSPVAPFFFFSAATAGGREKEIVEQLKARPPTYVVVISRQLQDYGIDYYGQSYGQGKAIMDWLEANYGSAWTMGGNPIDPNERGTAILVRHG
ncbi:MAG TPA: hypothetical protein VGG34_07140 [Opitutaceae bacterium]|jgi:hypothetical protein